MIVLGISGAIGYKVASLSSDNPWLPGAHQWVHGSGASLIIDGELVATMTEERFTRDKYDGNYPENCIDALLNRYNITKDQIDVVGFTDYIVPTSQLYYYTGVTQRILKCEFQNARIEMVRHHLAHGVQAFLTSKFDLSTVMTYDGGGSTYFRDNNHGTINFTLATFKKDKHGKLSDIIYHAKNFLTETSDNCLGFGNYYSNGSKTVMDIIDNNPRKNNENNAEKKWIESVPGKILGLGAYADNDCKQLVIPSEYTYALVQEDNETIPLVNLSHYRDLFNYYQNNINVYNKKTYAYGCAYLLQKTFENGIVDFLNNIPQSYKQQNICMGGGCSLNILANSRIANECGFENIHIPPSPGDDGLSQGIAMYVADKFTPDIVMVPDNLSCLGLDYSDEDVEDVLKSCTNIEYYKENDDDNLFKTVASFLRDNKIIAWFQGRSECGPRALGNRSIFANPIYPNKDILNQKVKFREYWRPYAAIVVADDVSEWFDLPVDRSDYMMFASTVKQDKLGEIPAVTHVDNTCRVQTVCDKSNEKVYKLLLEFKKQTRVPLLLNTSYNTIPGEPIVETPLDALKSFFYSNIDCLVIGNYIVTRKELHNGS